VGGVAASKLGIGKKTLIKKLEKIRELLRAGELTTALEEVEILLEKLTVEKPEDSSLGSKLQHLMGWYLRIWNGNPPEALRFLSYRDVLGRHFKELIQIYERNGETIDDLKRDYEAFKEKAFSSGKSTCSLLEFRVKLPSIKKREEVSGDTWCVGNERGKDYYLEFFFKHQAKPDKLN
jgi:hypothetical protein